MPQVARPLSQRISPAGVEAERAFPWLRSLAVEQRAQFFAELFLALGQALRQHDWHIVEDLISRWQATVEVLAVPAPVSPHWGTSPRTPVPRRTDRT